MEGSGKQAAFSMDQLRKNVVTDDKGRKQGRRHLQPQLLLLGHENKIACLTGVVCSRILARMSLVLLLISIFNINFSCTKYAVHAYTHHTSIPRSRIRARFKNVVKFKI